MRKATEAGIDADPVRSGVETPWEAPAPPIGAAAPQNPASFSPARMAGQKLLVCFERNEEGNGSMSDQKSKKRENDSMLTQGGSQKNKASSVCMPFVYLPF